MDDVDAGADKPFRLQPFPAARGLRLTAAGGQPTFGIDIESVVSTDMFSVARAALACERALENAAFRTEHGGIPDASKVTTKDALRWITIETARMLGIGDRVGSLTPGKQADITVIDATDWNMWPVQDPYSTVIMQAGVGNVEHVLIGGQFRKRDGRLLWADGERVKRELETSGRRIAASLGIPTQMDG